MSKGLQKRGSTDLAEKADYGNNNFDAKDLVIPRIKICQPTSREAKKADIKEGAFYNTVTMQSYGSKMEFFIILHWPGRIWFDKEEQKFQASQFKDVITGELRVVGPAASKVQEDETFFQSGMDTYSYMVVGKKETAEAVEESRPAAFAIFNCQSASLKYAKQLNTKLSMDFMRNIPLYGQSVIASTKAQEFTKGTAYMPVFTYGEMASVKEKLLLSEMHKIVRNLQSQKTEVHEEE